jgi:hypothetical protein
MTIYFSRFEAPRVYALRPHALGHGWLVHTFVLQADGTWEQRRPEKRPTRAGAESLVPVGAMPYPCPPDFADAAYAVAL